MRVRLETDAGTPIHDYQVTPMATRLDIGDNTRWAIHQTWMPDTDAPATLTVFDAPAGASITAIVAAGMTAMTRDMLP